jgi:hypothetical protein
MQIKIEIDVKPEELRRFLGLPDISGLQDDIINFLRDKMEAASDFHPTDFVKSNLDALRKTGAWKTLLSRVRIAEDSPPAAEAPPGKAKSRTAGKRKKKAKAAAPAAGDEEVPPIGQIGGG